MMNCYYLQEPAPVALGFLGSYDVTNSRCTLNTDVTTEENLALVIDISRGLLMASVACRYFRALQNNDTVSLQWRADISVL